MLWFMGSQRIGHDWITELNWFSDLEGKNIHMIKDNLFNKWCCENWTATYKIMKLDYFLVLYINANKKWIKNLKVGLETIKLEKKANSMLFDMYLSHFFFLGSATSGKGNKRKKNGVCVRDYIILKSFCMGKEISTNYKAAYWLRKLLDIICLIRS